MWTASVLGQFPRELRDGASGIEVSPDGTRITFTHGSLGYAREIWVMDSQGDNPQKVLALGENEWLVSVHWSPDGQRLAYLREQRTPEGYRRSIETCDLKGASRTVVVSADLHQQLTDFSWLPDGRIIYSNDNNLWQIGIDTHAGAPTGKPKRITQWAGSYLVGLSASADGKRLVLEKRTNQAQVYLGELAAGGTRMNPPRRLTNDEAYDLPTAWTPDSKAVLFQSNRNGTWGIFKQGLSQDTAELVVTAPQGVFCARPSADGAWIVYVENPKTRRWPLDSAPPDAHPCGRWSDSVCTGDAELGELRMRSRPGKPLRAPRDEPGSKTAHDHGIRSLERQRQGAPDRRRRPTASSHGGHYLRMGRRLRFQEVARRKIHIRLLSLSGGSDREITLKGWPNFTGLDWSPDGKGLYCGSASPQGRTLLYVDLEGNAQVLWQYKGAGSAMPSGVYLHRTAATSPYWAPSSTAMCGWWKVSERREGCDWNLKLFEWRNCSSSGRSRRRLIAKATLTLN